MPHEYTRQRQGRDFLLHDTLTVILPASLTQDGDTQSREENSNKQLYFLTASGMIDSTAQYFRDVYSDEQHKWVNYQPTEAEFDELLPKIAERFESDMADSSKCPFSFRSRERVTYPARSNSCTAVLIASTLSRLIRDNPVRV